MGGGWFGYVYVLGACGLVLGLLACSTLVLYAVARVQNRRRPEPSVRVVPVPPRQSDAA